eukprot:g2077.t1
MQSPLPDTRDEPELSKRPLHGLRVVEVSTVAAAPSAARCLADAGATVIKVEEPSGDIMRQLFIQMDGPPTKAKSHGSMFEGLNFSKSSIQLNLKSEEGRAILLGILNGADVLITNVRPAPLQRMGLDFSTLSKRFPSLIYAQLSAWGLSGEHKDNAGYDFGAFWAASGLAHHFHAGRSWRTMLYPGTFGDLCTGQTLVAGICLALIERQRNGGRGMLVDTCLLRVGMYCCAGEIVRGNDAEGAGGCDGAHDIDDEACICLPTADGGPQLLLTPPLNADSGAPVRFSRDHRDTVCKALGLAPGAPFAELRRAATSRPSAEVMRTLRASSVCVSQLQTQLDAVAHPDPRSGLDFEPSTPWARPPLGIEQPDGVERVVAVPWHFSNGPSQGCTPRWRAPRKGEHTSAILKALTERGTVWEPRPADELNHSPKQHLHEPHVRTTQACGALDGLLIVELSDSNAARHDVTAGSCAALLASSGATLVRIVSGVTKMDTDGMQIGGMRAQLDRCKIVCSPEALGAAGSSAHELCQNADAIVTSMPERALRDVSRWGVDWDWDALEARTKRGYLVLTRITPWGLRHERENEGLDGIVEAMFATTGFGAAFQTSYNMPPPLDSADDEANGMPKEQQHNTPQFTMPRQSLAFYASLFAVSGTSVALAGRMRHGGQVVDVSLARAGHWFVQQNDMFFRSSNRGVVPYFQRFGGTAHAYITHVPATFGTYRCADGAYIQALGLDWLAMLPKWINRLGLGWQAYPALLRAIFFDLLPRLQELKAAGPGALQLVGMAVGAKLRPIFSRAMSSRTWDQIEREFGQKDLWYTKVHTPAEAYQYPHAHQCGAFALVGESTSTSSKSPPSNRIIAPPFIVKSRKWTRMAAPIDTQQPRHASWLRDLLQAINEADGQARSAALHTLLLKMGGELTEACDEPAMSNVLKPTVTSSCDHMSAPFIRPRL